MRWIKSLFVVLVISPLASEAADCTAMGIAPSSDESIAFTVNADGTAVDHHSGLMWMRCALGQTWDRSQRRCNGTAFAMEWDRALVAVDVFNAEGGFAGFTDWRLPNINELRSIVEDCRAHPAINTLIFPQSPQKPFWSASPYAVSGLQAWLVDFSLGRDNYDLKNRFNFVRLVRVAR